MEYTSGEKLLDLQAGNSAYLFGYNNQYIIDSIADATKDLSFIRGNRGETSSSTVVVSQHICETGGFDKMSYAVSGSSAVEAALAMASYYNDREKIVALYPAYHGTTRFTKALAGQVNDPNIEYIEKQSEAYILHNLKNKCAKGDVLAFVMETCSWVSGVHKFSTEFWQSVRNICDRYDTLMITDDVAMCWFRYTNDYHSWKLHGVQPDITAIGKALSGGYFPIGAAACTKKVSDKIDSWQFGHTWHPSIGGVAAIKAVTTLLEQGDWKNKWHSVVDRFTEICDDLLMNGVIDGYRQAGLFVTLDTPYTFTTQEFVDNGLLLNEVPASPGSLKLIGSLACDDEFFDTLEERLFDMFMGK